MELLFDSAGSAHRRRETRRAAKEEVSAAAATLAPADGAMPTKIAGYEHFLNLLSESPHVVDRSTAEIERGWHPGAAAMLVEVGDLAPTPNAAALAIALLQRKADQQVEGFDAWYRWLWSRKYDPHPEYARFKRELYGRIDNRFSEYFGETADARIRLDEIRWGGVVRDGIPPLKNPKMISAEEATFLHDSNVVFGVKLNGDARCYPKRILAWHEMFKDTIGAVPVCGAY